MNNKNIYLITLLIPIISGCATAPDVKLGYYLPQASMTVKAIQTIKCKVVGVNYSPILETTFSQVVKYSDNKAQKYYLNPKELGGVFTDSKFSLTYQGGRLSKFTPCVTGKGNQAIDLIEGIFSKSTSLKFNVIVDNNATAKHKEIVSACKVLKNTIDGPLKHVQVEFQWYVSNFDLNPIQLTSKEVKSDLITFEQISAIVDVPIIKINKDGLPDSLHQYTSACTQPTDDSGPAQTTYANCLSDVGEIAVSAPQKYMITVQLKDKNDLMKDVIINSINVPQSGSVYTLPIPKGFLFGGADANFEFNSDGSLKAVSYNHTSGVEAFGKSVSALQSELESDSNKDRADKIKSESDLLYQQKRLKNCQNNPSTCAK